MNGGEAYPPPSLAGLRAAISSGRYSIALAIAGFVALVIYYFRFIGHPDGMIVYPGAASCLMRGEPLVTCSAGFTYPPFFAFVMIPFTFLPLWGRNFAWYVVLVTAAIGSFKICEALIVKAFHIRHDELPWLRIFSLALSLKLILGVFENQAYDVLVFFFALVGLYGLTYDKTVLASVGFAIATALKATPILFFVYLLFLRKWKMLALGVIFCAVASLLPDVLYPPNDTQAGYLSRWITEVGGGGLFGAQLDIYPRFWQGANHLNQSLRTFVFRIIYGQAASGTDFGAESRMILYVVYLVYGMAAAAVIVRSSKIKGSHIWAGSILFMSMVLLSPMSSKSHFVVLLLPYMAVVAYLIKHRESWRAAMPLLIGSFAFNTLTAKAIIGRGLSDKMLFLGCITIGTLLLLATVSLLTFRSRTDERSANS